MDAEALSFVVIGDTQRTSFTERAILRRESNDLEREIIFRSVLEHRPNFTAIVGDLVCNGLFKIEWDYFSDLNLQLRQHTIPVFPAIGNHDFKIKKYFDIFSEQDWYSKIIGGIGFIWLNTNVRAPAQKNWFDDTISAFEAAGDIKHIIVFGHHPPFTNSRIVRPSIYVQKTFAEKFFQTRKGIFFFSGHNHSFEKFKFAQKYFIVTGGGGGPRCEAIKFPFHYLVVSHQNGIFRVEGFGLQKGEHQVRRLFSFLTGEK